MPKKPSLRTVEVNVALVETDEHALPDALPQLLAHAFDRNGEVVTSAPLKKTRSGLVTAKLKLPTHLQGQGMRLVLGPPVEEVMDNVPEWMTALMTDSDDAPGTPAAVSSMMRRGAYQKYIHHAPELEKIDLVLQPPDWIRWLMRACVVRGRLVKRLPLPDGTTRELGICHACVKIYEVDSFPRLIAKLPDKDLFRLRDDLAGILTAELPPREIPELEKIPDLWPPPPGPLTEATKLGPQPIPPGDPTMLGPQPIPPGNPVESFMIESALVDQMQPIFQAPSATYLRTALVDSATHIAPFLCLVPWFYRWFAKDLIKCVCTDAEGRFETTIWYRCVGDKPDLYFRALQCIGGQLHVLYDPGVACNTWWNYSCGTEVVLVTDDPAARVCVQDDHVIVPPGTKPWIMPFAVGGIRLDRIDSAGLTDYGSIVDAPFGGRLGFRLGHSSGIPDSTIVHYRWLYKKDGPHPWREFADPVAAPVHRHFVDEDLANPALPPTFPVYTLGPHAVAGKHLYEFRPHTPPAVPGHSRYWPLDSWFNDIYAAILRSTALPGGVATAAGRYTIKVEIYDGSGSRLQPGTHFRFIVPIGLAPDGTTIIARNAFPTEIDTDGFVFKLHIDNRRCTAYIDAPTIGGVPASDNCGFLRYSPGDNVRIGYHAIHPDQLATHHFWIRRAIQIVSNVYGEVSAPSMAYGSLHSYSGDGLGNFAKTDFTTNELLGTCTEGAFAEMLRVRAKATNGWTRLHEYDASHQRAFALAPETP